MIEAPSKYEILTCLRCHSQLTVWRGGKHTTAEWKEVKRKHRDWLAAHGFETCKATESTYQEIIL